MILWEYHSGKLAWSMRPAHVTPYRKLLREFQSRAAYRETESLVALLENLCDSTLA